MSKVPTSTVSRRNNFSMRFLGMLVMFVGLSVSGYAATVFSETMGSGGSNGSTISNWETNSYFDQDNYTMSGTGDMRNTTISNYSGASGTWNVMLNTSSENFQIAGINTSSYINLSLSFGVYKGTNAENGSTLTIAVSSDGSNWTTLTMPSLSTGTGSAIWYNRTCTGTIPSTSNLYIKFTSSSTTEFRIDDILLTGTALSAPIVTYSSASSITTTSATLNGNVTSDGGAAITERGFVYKTTAGTLITDNKTSVAGTTGAFTLSPTLSINTRYYFKAYAINSVGTTLSTPELDFWTLANVPSAPTVSNATPNTLDVAVNANSNPASTEFAIQETGGSQFVQANGTLGASAVWQTATNWGTKTVTGLSSGTSYGFQVKARNGANAETAFGSSASLSTITVSSPTIFSSGTLSAVNTTYGTASASPTSFNVSGSAMDEGITVTPPAGFEVSLSAAVDYANSIIVGSAGTISSTTVYVRLKATAAVAGSPYSGNIVLSSNNATSANLATVSSTVSPYTLSVSGLSGVNKTYDGQTTATLSGTATLSASVNSDVITLSGTAVGAFSSATVANNKTINITGLSISGANSSSYSLTAPTTTANITAAPLTISGISITEKTYNGNTTATITGSAAYDGLVNSESFTVTGSPSAVFADANVNTNIAVTVSGYAAPSANYSVTQPTGLTGNIIKANQTITLASTATNYIGVADYIPATSATSGVNAITYTSSNTNVATIVSGNIRIIGVGETTITASQAASANYNAAANVTQTLTVTVNTDFFRSKASGNWNAIGTWESSANGTSGWANATITPGATNSVYIQTGHTVTLAQNESCKDLNISNGTASGGSGTDGVLQLATYTLQVNGYLRSYYAAVGTTPGTGDNTVTNMIVTTSGTTGLIKFVGDSRDITPFWGQGNTGALTAFAVEIALNSDQIATMSNGIKAKSWTISSGTLNSGTTRIAPDNGSTGGGDITINNGAIVVSSATGTNGSAVIARTTNSSTGYGGAFTNNGTLKLTGNSPTIAMSTITLNGTVEYNGTNAQSMLSATGGGPANPNTYTNLKINNSAGVTLTQNITVNGTLDLTSGKIATAANTLTIGADGSVTNASTTSYINGNLVKLIKAGTDPTKTFEIGDGTTYAPVSVAITGTISNSTGSIQAVTTSADHANIATSGLFKTVNRKWTLSSPAAITGLTSYNPTFNFVSGDIDAGATTSNFVVKRYASSAWTAPTTGTKTATSTQATGLAAYGDFVIGEVIGVSTATAATNVTSSSFRLNLNAVTDATGYFIDVATDEAFTSFLQNSLGIGLNTLYNLSFLSANTTYYYRVRAAGANASTSANSNVISVTTLASYSVGLTAGSNGVITSGAGNYDAGASVTVVATPNSGFRFESWTEGGSPVSTLASYTFTASGNRTLVANFASNTVGISSGTINASALVNCTNCDVTVASGAELNVNQTTNLNSLTVSAGAKLTLQHGSALNSPITLQTSSTGNATFVDKRTDETPSAISGTVLQYMPQGRNWYVTSPVADAQTSALTAVGLGSSVSYWNEAGSAWVNSYSGALTRGVGYIAVSNAGSGTNNVSFSGNFYSGPVPVALTRKGTSSIGYNLIANPYPSYLNAMEAINANANVQKTIWYRTRSTGTTPLYKFETVNTTSGEGTDAAGTGTVTGYVPPMQAFWVRTLTDNNSITFTNAMRYHRFPYIHDTTIPTTPLKAPGNTQAANKLVRLQVAKGNSTDETVVYFNPNAAVGFDDYDSPKWSNASAAIPELYTIASNEMLAINGLPEIVYNAELPLGFYAGTASVYSIKAKELRNIDSSTRVILKDGSIEYDLTNGDSYQFNSAEVNNANRFSLIFRTAGVATEVNATELDSKTSMYVNANGELIVNTAAPLKSGAHVSVYNAIGQQISIQPLYSSSTIATAAKTAGVYWVKISNDGEVVTRKVVLK